MASDLCRERCQSSAEHMSRTVMPSAMSRPTRLAMPVQACAPPPSWLSVFAGLKSNSMTRNLLGPVLSAEWCDIFPSRVRPCIFDMGEGTMNCIPPRSAHALRCIVLKLYWAKPQHKSGSPGNRASRKAAVGNAPPSKGIGERLVNSAKVGPWRTIPSMAAKSSGGHSGERRAEW